MFILNIFNNKNKAAKNAALLISKL